MSKVLVVDDDIQQLTDVAKILSEAGHRVDCAVDPQDALEHLETEKVELVIASLTMPYMSGIELMDEVHKLKPKLPFFIISKIDDQELILNTHEWGAKEFISSPINAKNLLALAAKQLR